MTTDPQLVGQRVLAALEAGRARAIELQRAKGAATERAVRRALDIDILEGRHEWGRAGRIARRLSRAGLPVSERNVRKILARLSSSADLGG